MFFIRKKKDIIKSICMHLQHDFININIIQMHCMHRSRYILKIHIQNYGDYTHQDNSKHLQTSPK